MRTFFIEITKDIGKVTSVYLFHFDYVLSVVSTRLIPWACSETFMQKSF